MHLELVIVDGPQAGRRIPLGRNAVTFGRSSGAVISFPLDRFMSGMHLSVQYALSCIIVVDLRSSNGTFLNGQRITQEMAVPGDAIKIGTLTMQVAIGKAPAPEAGPVEPVASPELPTIATTIEMPAVTEPMIDVPEEESLDVAEEPAGEVGATSAGPDEKVQRALLNLLSEAELPLFCLLDAGAHAMIPSLLGSATEPKESLYDGDAGNMLAKFAPYVVQLGADSSLLRTLIEKGWGQGWICFFTSQAPLEELSGHFRKFFMVQLEGGKEIYFRFYDPRVLRGFLPAASAEELAVFFGPVAEWLLEARNSAMLLRISNASDGLHTRTIPLAITSSMARR